MSDVQIAGAAFIVTLISAVGVSAVLWRVMR
jgi:hypothetical protein